MQVGSCIERRNDLRCSQMLRGAGWCDLEPFLGQERATTRGQSDLTADSSPPAALLLKAHRHSMKKIEPIGNSGIAFLTLFSVGVSCIVLG